MTIMCWVKCVYIHICPSSHMTINCVICIDYVLTVIQYVKSLIVTLHFSHYISLALLLMGAALTSGFKGINENVPRNKFPYPAVWLANLSNFI